MNWFTVATIPIVVTFRTCHAVAARTLHGRINSGIGFTIMWMTWFPLLSGRFHITRVILRLRKMSHVEKYKAQDLRKMQMEDETTAQIIRWLEDDHKPSQVE